MKMNLNLQHYYKTLNGPKADPMELNLWTMIPMSTTTRAVWDVDADEVAEQMDSINSTRSLPPFRLGLEPKGEYDFLNH